MGKDVDVGTQGREPGAALRKAWECHILSVLETENTQPETKEGENQLIPGTRVLEVLESLSLASTQISFGHPTGASVWLFEAARL